MTRLPLTATRRRGVVGVALVAAAMACATPGITAAEDHGAGVPALSMRVDGSAPSPAYGDRRVSPPVVSGGQSSVEVPYRVSPRDANGRLVTPWDVPPEKPDPRDFEEVRTFDELANPQYEIREEIWNTPEDFITREGLSRVDGIAWVPHWARNTIRFGRWQVYPFVDAQVVWTSNALDGASDERALEAVLSVGALAEYLAPGGKSKVKAGVRGDWHGYDRALPDATTYLGGIGIEHRFGQRFTIDAGGEIERVVVPTSRNPIIGNDDDLIERWTVYGNGRWDRFLSDDLRLEGGVQYSETDEVDSGGDGGDHEDLALFGRLSWAIMRHEGFGYVEYRYETRNGHGLASDLDAAHEVRVGVNNILPHGRTRRLVGDLFAGWRQETYSIPAVDGAYGQGEDNEASTWTAGAALTYRPGPYTSGYLSYVHTNTFSTVSNFNTEDAVYLGITQNLTSKVVGRIAASWLRLEPQGGSSSDRLGFGVGVRWILTDDLDLTADYEFSHRYAGGTLSAADTNRIAVGMTLGLR